MRSPAIVTGTSSHLPPWRLIPGNGISVAPCGEIRNRAALDDDVPPLATTEEPSVVHASGATGPAGTCTSSAREAPGAMKATVPAAGPLKLNASVPSGP